jgi:transglutaminase-like putative cysteine protease
LIYDIRHKTTFTYEEVVSVSHHVLHLAPRRHVRQRSLEAAMRIDPAPAVDSEGKDYFGNSVYYLTVQEPHERLVVDARSRVEVLPMPAALDLAASASWESVAEMLGGVSDEALLNSYQFAFELAVLGRRRRGFTTLLQSFVPGRPILEAAMDLDEDLRSSSIAGAFPTFPRPCARLPDAEGVCQDFAHLEARLLTQSLAAPLRRRIPAHASARRQGEARRVRRRTHGSPCGRRGRMGGLRSDQ